MSVAVNEETGEIIEPEGEPDPQEDGDVTEGEPQPDGEPQPEEDEPQGLSEGELEALQEKLSKEATRHRNRVSELMAEDAQSLAPCPLCPENLAGLIYPDHIPDDVRATVVAYLTGVTEEAYLDDDEAEMCTRCNGMGETRTHSRVVGQESIVCKMCQGKGWTTAQERATYASQVGAAAVSREIGLAPVADPLPSGDLPSFDAWNRPFGHEFYGHNPMYMTAEQRERDFPGAR